MAQVMGADKILANYDRWVAGQERKAEAALAAVCVALVEWAKAEHGYHDRTGELTASITAHVTRESGGMLSARLTASAPEAVFLELAHAGQWAFLLPIIERHQADILAIIKTGMGGNGGLS